MSIPNYIDEFPLEKEAVDTILNIKDEFIGKISEELFRTRFLPMLASPAGNVDLREWVAIAGHVFNEVEVIKDGNVLFKVPSILRRPNTKSHKYANQSVYEIMENSRLNSVNSPVLGDRILQKGLEETLPETTIDLTDAERWDAILKRYGYNNSSTVVVDGASSQLLPVSDKIDFDGFDPA